MPSREPQISFSGHQSPSRRAWVERTGHVTEGEFEAFRKTSVTYARRIDVPFVVDTLEGLHEGKAGDWLAIGAKGEMYPIAADVFEATYAPAKVPHG